MASAKKEESGRDFLFLSLLDSVRVPLGAAGETTLFTE